MTADAPRTSSTEAEPGHVALTAFWTRVESVLDRESEWLNPILVKEARQALKSRQFLVTFSLLLLIGWAWSFLGIALLSPGVYFLPGGRFMLLGYYFAIAVPLLVVVPFSAFRSLAAEREDGTFELLTITALSARQIVTGKLGSAVLQMFVFYSALSPCVAFTYLLRGLDILTVLCVLVWTFLASLLLAAAGLFAATITRSRNWQSLLSVVLIVLLSLATIAWSSIIVAFLSQTAALDSADFWMGTLAGLSFYASFLVMLVLAAAAQISFASDNRSTQLRVVMLVQQLLWVGWITYYWLRTRIFEVLILMPCLAAAYWWIMGTILSGETARLSPRARRSLPQSFLGRMTWTWFNPGSGTGYVFAFVNLAVVIFAYLLLGIVATLVGFEGQPQARDAYWPTLGCLLWSYAVIYVGLGRLLMLASRLRIIGGIAASIGVQVVLVVTGAALPFFFQLWVFDFVRPEYTRLQTVNWLWTLIETVDHDIWSFPTVPVAVGGGALAMFALHLILTARDVQQLRADTPQRVLEEDRLSASPSAEYAAPRSPFDD